MFGRRSDATLVRNLPKLRLFMPYVSPRRNDSLFYYAHEIEVDAALYDEGVANPARLADVDRLAPLFDAYRGFYGQAAYYLGANRNKRSVAIDFSRPTNSGITMCG